METAIALGFLLFGLGFFLFTTHMIIKSDNTDYQRVLNEQREFGYRFTAARRSPRSKHEPHD